MRWSGILATMIKTVFITGASSGIGRAAALYFAGQGWNVAATVRTVKSDDVDFAKFSAIRQYQLDVTDGESIQAAIRVAVKDFGSIDVLVNNAGYGTVGAFEASTPEQVQKQFDVNVFGLMNVTRLMLPIFRKQGQGKIINISSMGGRLAFPLYSIYHATKWAVDGFSESLMYELAGLNIGVKIIEPGTIKTQFTGRSAVKLTKTGLDAYSAYETKIAKNYEATYENAASPELVAKTIYKAATDESSRLRYVVGAPAPMLMLLRRILPESLFFAGVRHQTK